MNHYETIYIVKVNEWGKRKLAYELKRFDKGYYVVLDFCALPKMVTELERNLKLDDRILKYITVKIDENIDPKDLVSKEKGIEDTIEESHNEQVEEK